MTLENDQFIDINGKPMLLYSASFHYARTPPEHWQDVLDRLKAMGANAIQTYIPWNFHEGTEGAFNFEGDRDLAHFLSLVKSTGLHALVRMGPYICGEWDFGGLPAWLINKNVTIRTYEDNYIRYVDRWFAQMLPVLKGQMDVAGGAVLMVQVENEYGSYGNVAGNPADKKYVEHLANITRAVLGQDTVVYTTDGGSESYMSHGSLKGDIVLTLGDGLFSGCTASKDFNPPGKNPCMDTELYTGWLTHWSEPIAMRTTASLVSTIAGALEKNQSFNFYMGFGGTNFGFWAGANGGGTLFNMDITSYDYDSPVQENGDNGVGSDGVDKYTALRNLFLKYNPDLPTPPAPRKRGHYGEVTLKETAQFMAAASESNLQTLANHTTHTGIATPTNMESFGQNFGNILYTVKSLPVGGNDLAVSGYVRDWARIFINGKRMPGVIKRTDNLPLQGLQAKVGDRLDILVETMGRLNFGSKMFDMKGIVDAVTLDGHTLNSTNGAVWEVQNLHLEPEQVHNLTGWVASEQSASNPLGPNFFRGTLDIPDAPLDTYINTKGWGKGFVWINGFNLGRYWEALGPQHALYIPKSALRQGANVVQVLEFEAANTKGGFGVNFTGEPDFSGKPPPDCKATPGAGTTLTMVTCSSTLQAFTNASGTAPGTFTLQTGGLCVTAVQDAKTKNTWAELQACGDSASQDLTYNTDTQAIRLHSSGDCLDVYQDSVWMLNCFTPLFG